uniref:Reverse transcriptase domain-containing protein n=1 Tax=Myripristis murdjan TaxID=586833 RepID=A0A667YBN6_9TELE
MVSHHDLLLAIDADSTSVLLLLDLSAVFDTVDHCILLDRLTENFGSYLSERTQCVMYNNTKSKFSNVKCRVPQGSVLGPLLFSLYISPLGQIICSHGINFHCYADDTQLYLPIKADDPTEITRLEVCLVAVKNWMSRLPARLMADAGGWVSLIPWIGHSHLPRLQRGGLQEKSSLRLGQV